MTQTSEANNERGRPAPATHQDERSARAGTREESAAERRETLARAGAARAMAVQLERACIVVVGRECVTRCQPTRTARTRPCANSPLGASPPPPFLLSLSSVRAGSLAASDRGSHDHRTVIATPFFVSTGNNTYLWTICTCVKNRQRANPGRFASRRGEWFATPPLDRSSRLATTLPRGFHAIVRPPAGSATLSGEHPRRAIARTALLQSRIGPSQETAPEIR